MPVIIPDFLEAACLAARQVGVVARRLQGQVVNEGKDIGDATGLTDHQRRLKSAKTAVDEIAQDIILQALAPHLPLEDTVLDGEEDTPGKTLFPATSGSYVLVIDPIDGTLIYLEGKKAYAVHIGLFKAGKVEAALVYYPALNVGYFTDGQKAYRANEMTTHGLSLREEVHFAPTPAHPNLAFVYGEISRSVKDAIDAAGFKRIGTFRVDKEVDPVTGILRGEVALGVLEHIQLRDAMHLAILSVTGQLKLTDWEGRPAVWPQGGAIPKMLVSAWPLPPKLFSTLAPHL